MGIVLVDAPSNLGLKRPAVDREPGVRFAPWQLRRLGLAERLAASDGGSVEPPAYTGLRDEATGTLHAPLLGPYAVALADALGPVLARGDFPLLLGGDCSILSGAALALRRRGRHGLVFLDGHRDLLRPEDTSHGAAAGMDLAFATGHGPTLLVRIDGEMPLVAPDDVLLFGYRDEDRWYTPGMLAVAADSMRGIALEEARQQDIDRVFARRLAQLLEAPLDGFWLHLDVDVLDDAAMSAVDARQPDGMTTEELARLLAAAVASGRCLGMQVCNYDPERDPGMACGRRLVELLGEGLAALRPEAAAAAGESAGAPAGEPIE